MSKDYKKDIITCYTCAWNNLGDIPRVEDVLDLYNEYKSEELLEMAMDFYNIAGCQDDVDRILQGGLTEQDYYTVGFELIVSPEDVDIILEDAGVTFIRNETEVVNSSATSLFCER